MCSASVSLWPFDRPLPLPRGLPLSRVRDTSRTGTLASTAACFGERVNRRHSVGEVRGESGPLCPVEVSSGQVLTGDVTQGCRLR